MRNRQVQVEMETRRSVCRPKPHRCRGRGSGL